MKIALCLAHTGTVKTSTMVSIINLLNETRGEKLLRVETGPYVDDNRYRLCRSALDQDCDFVFFIDHDMVMPGETINRLIAHDKDIIGCNYHTRRLPLVSTVKLWGDSSKVNAPMLTEMTREDFPTSLFQCAALGTGAMLISRDALEQTAQPWFGLEKNPDGSNKIGDDIGFCLRAQDAGFTIWCDPTIPVQHIGDWAF